MRRLTTVAALSIVATAHAFAPAGMSRTPASTHRRGATYAVAPVAVESNPIFIDESAMIDAAGFSIAPAELIRLAKRFLVSRGGFGADPDLLSEDFAFVGPADCGLGCFARVPLLPGQAIGEYGGPRLPLRFLEHGGFALQVPGTAFFIDGNYENAPYKVRSP